MKKYVINGFKWFERVNGNTYHNVNIIDVETNTLIVSSGMVYGYGSQWEHTAYDALIKLGLVNEEDRHNHELNRKRFLKFVVDVPRKKDLNIMDVDTSNQSKEMI